MDNDTFAGRFKTLRYLLRLSQEEMAKKLGVTQHTISNYENGKRFPTVDVVEKLKQFQNIDLNWLIFGDSYLTSIVNPNDPNIIDFFYWFNKYHVVRIEALSSLAHLKITHEDLFNVSENPDISKRPYQTKSSKKQKESKNEKNEKIKD